MKSWMGYMKLHAIRAALVVAMCCIAIPEAAAFNGDPSLRETQRHIVFLISEDPDNYEAHKTIPVFAEQLQRQHGFKVSVLLGEGERSAFRFPGLEVIRDADLLVVFCRRIALSHEQLNMIKSYLQRGKPVVGLRTANHAFSVRDEIKSGYEAWWDFVPQILGCENRGYGPVEPGTEVSIVSKARKHPLLKGIEPAQWHSKGNVYLVAPLLDEEATVLLTGQADQKVEPIAWTRHTADGSRVFYTSLGYPSDFKMPQFLTLLSNGIFWAMDLAVPRMDQKSKRNKD